MHCSRVPVLCFLCWGSLTLCSPAVAASNEEGGVGVGSGAREGGKRKSTDFGVAMASAKAIIQMVNQAGASAFIHAQVRPEAQPPAQPQAQPQGAELTSSASQCRAM